MVDRITLDKMHAYSRRLLRHQLIQNLMAMRVTLAMLPRLHCLDILLGVHRDYVVMGYLRLLIWLLHQSLIRFGLVHFLDRLNQFELKIVLAILHSHLMRNAVIGRFGYWLLLHLHPRLSLGLIYLH